MTKMSFEYLWDRITFPVYIFYVSYLIIVFYFVENAYWS